MVTLAQVNAHMLTGAANDQVNQNQLETYLPLMPDVVPVLNGQDIDMRKHSCDLPTKVRQELRAIMIRAHVRPGHRWVRGLVATYMEVRDR